MLINNKGIFIHKGNNDEKFIDKILIIKHQQKEHLAVIENNNHKRTVSYAIELSNNHIIKEDRHIKSRNRMYFSDDLFKAISKDTKQSSTTSFGCHNSDLRSIARITNH